MVWIGQDSQGAVDTADLERKLKVEGLIHYYMKIGIINFMSAVN